MNYLAVIFFGIIQGITEFLPISSSAHLLLLHKYISIPINNILAFDVSLHIATLLAVLLYLRESIGLIIGSVFRGIRGKKDENYWLFLYLLLATIPAGAIGYLFADFIKTSVYKSDYSFLIIAVMLFSVGIFLLIADKEREQKKTCANIGWKNALTIGLAQALALIPGTSRSGATIAAGLFSGLERKEAIKFSFLLSIPIISGAGLKEIPELVNASMQADEVLLLMLAFVSAFLAGYASIRFLIKIVTRHSFRPFVYYRFLLALVLFFYFFLNF